MVAVSREGEYSISSWVTDVGAPCVGQENSTPCSVAAFFGASARKAVFGNVVVPSFGPSLVAPFFWRLFCCPFGLAWAWVGEE